MDDPSRTSDSGTANLTRAQFLIWMGQRLSPESPLYNMAMTFTITGDLDPEVFVAAFAELVARSDSMRTVMDSEGENPHRTVRATVPYTLLQLDFRPKSGDVNRRFRDWSRTRAQQSFQLDRCLFDCALIRISEDRWGWYLNKHHLITDGWSMAVIYSAVQTLYGHIRRGSLAEVPALPPYEDYVQYEKSRRASTTFAKAKTYWKEKAHSAPEPIDFYGRSPLAGGTTRTDRVSYNLGVERSRRLRDLTGEKDIRTMSVDLSLFNVFSTLLFAYLARISGQDHLAILAPTHNRPTPAFKNTIGLFIEILPLHIEISDDETLQSLYGKVAAESRAFLLNAQPGTSSSVQNRSYSVLLNYINSSFSPFDELPMESDWVHADHGDSSHSLRLQVHDFDGSGSFCLHFDLNREVFDEERQGWVVQHFISLLDAFLLDRTQTLESVDLTSQEEREENLIRFNQTQTVRPDRTVLDEFALQVERTPDAIAAECGKERLSFKRLDQRSDLLAERLRSEGATTHRYVAIFMSRSLQMLVSLLAVLKMGRAYVPIDPTYPSSRVQFILEDSGAGLVLVDEQSPALPAGTSTQVLIVEAPSESLRPTDGDANAKQIAEPAPPLADTHGGTNTDQTNPPVPDDLVYMIYTSGSTGQPKGAEITHRGLAHYISWAREFYLHGEPLAFPLYSSFSFDLTVTSIFVPLVSGGRIVIYPEEDGPDFAILRVLSEDRVDIVKLTPAHLALIQTAGIRNQRLRQIIVGGEDLKTDLAVATRASFDDRVEICNEYGPTEATVGCMIHRFDPESDLAASVPIGAPIDNARIYVLDRRQQPVPIGFVGEMWIGGPGVARGYHGRPDLTSERFLPDPFAAQGTMYRTGDRARFRAPGVLEFLGRDDDQVKIRGARIELGEIAAALQQHALISDAAVVVAEERQSAPPPKPVRHCIRCGLASNHPEAELEDNDTCGICRSYDDYRETAERYFRNMDDLRELFANSRASDGRPSPGAADVTGKGAGPYDCLMLLSGGKDSTYALHQLVEMGLNVLAFNLDNGYISEGAKENIRRTTQALGIELVWGRTPAMNEIFVDSLRTFSNVCQGCFKTIFTLGTNLARERGIPIVVTGLSRGQIFETRLADLLRAGIEDPDDIDAAIIEARKAYHRMDDVVAQTLDVSAFADDQVFEDIRIVDFYRYSQVELAEMMKFLDDRAPWVRPADTGRSTNCLINDTGILLHKKVRGFHNYALPYSWDVRLGHKTRDAALAELDDEIDLGKTLKIIAEIGYADDPDTFDLSGGTEKRLTAYYVTQSEDESAAPQAVRAFLAQQLPDFMIPSFMVPLEQLPLTTNGKVDRRALPDPRGLRDERAGGVHLPRTKMESLLAEIWQRVLRVRTVGIHDHFLEIGGDSILGLQLVAQAQKAGLKVTPRQVFEFPTIAELAVVVRAATGSTAETEVLGSIPLTPIQHWFFAQNFQHLNQFNQALEVVAREPVDLARLQQAFVAVTQHHDILRARFQRAVPDSESADWTQEIPTDAARGPLLVRMNATGSPPPARFDLETGPLARIAIRSPGPKIDRFRLDIHHLVIDAVSWSTLLADLSSAYEQLSRDQTVTLPQKSTSFRDWSRALVQAARNDTYLQDLDFWREMTRGTDGSSSELGSDPHVDPDNRGAHRPVSASIPGSHETAPPSTIRMEFDAVETSQILEDLPGVFNTRIDDALLTALTSGFCEILKSDYLRIDLEQHGRESIEDDTDLSRTVGWFTAIHPLRLRHVRSSLTSALKATKETLRSVPQNGLGYGVLRYLGEFRTRRELSERPRSRILFNYLGRLADGNADNLFRPAAPLTLERAPGEARVYDLEVNAYVYEGELHTLFEFDPARYTPSTVRKVADGFAASLRKLTREALSGGSGGYTPSDIAGAEVSQADIDDIMDDFAE